MWPRRFFFFGAILFFAFAGLLAAVESPEPVDKAWLEEHYAKVEYHVPMRDSVKLLTAVFSPRDTSTNYPIWLARTPYSVGAYGSNAFPVPKGPMKYYAREGFIFVIQDVRGRNGSEGEFVQVRPLNSDAAHPSEADESTDAWDTIDWLVKHVANNNGRVGMSGISYPGFYASCGAINSHPALKAVSPQAPIGDWFIGDDYHRNGALYLSRSFDSGLNQMLARPTKQKTARYEFGTQDGYQFFLGLGPLASVGARTGYWQDLVTHGNYDEYWQARNPRPHLTNIHSAVLMVGGWYDSEDLFGALETYRGIEKQNPGIQNRLVMGPWSHGGWSSEEGRKFGPLNFDSNTCAFFRSEVELPFFNAFLKGNGKCDLPEASVFETGANEWRRFNAWPPVNATAKSLYLRAKGRLSFSKPGEAGDAFDQYVSDPANPLPFTADKTLGVPREYMVADQRFAATRPDVLVYQSEALKEPVTLAGPVGVDLNVSTTGSDSDWVVKLIDVHPAARTNAAEAKMAAYQQLVRGEPMRGKFRNSFEKPEPFEPGKPAKVEWAMCDVFHTFLPGHRIMVQVQSSWFPLFDRNPQTFCDIYRAKPGDFQTATQRVFRTASAASCLRVTVLPPRRELAPIDTSGFGDSRHHWRHIRDTTRFIQVVPGQPEYRPDQVREIAANILLFQRENGGWPKDYDMLAVLTPEQKAVVLASRGRADTSFDNGNLHSQVDYLAHASAAADEPEWRDACIRGFDFILASQYPNGGFPQRYPNARDFHAHITFNDYVMIGSLNVLQDAAEGAPQFAWLDSARRERARDAVRRGVDCILKCQIFTNGTLTGWCQQHDEKTFEARPGRTFELASICPQDTTYILRLLMRLKAPGEQVVHAVDAGAAWLKRVELSGLRVKRVPAPPASFERHDADFDLIVEADAQAPPIWARHYEIGTERPVFAGRDGIRRYALADIERERRTGTAWYGNWPKKFLAQEYPEWRAGVETGGTRPPAQ